MFSKSAALAPALVVASLLFIDAPLDTSPSQLDGSDGHSHSDGYGAGHMTKTKVSRRGRKPAASKREEEVQSNGCPSVTVMTAATAGHCCWPAQSWSAESQSCVGTPTCPEGFVVQSDSCICPEGKREGVTTKGHCCWPGQEWSVKRKECAGVPTSCPLGQRPDGENCTVPPAEPTKAAAQETTEELLDKVTPKVKETKKPVVVDSGPKLPEQLTRAEIFEGLKSAEAGVHECYDHYGVSGTAMVNVTIMGNGHVRSAPVSGKLAGTDTGNCVEAAVKEAHFKQFSGPATSIGYPYILR